MASRKDWLPGKRADILEMSLNWSTVLDDKGDAWSVPAGQVSALDGLITAAQTALNATQGAGRGPVATANCKAAFAALVEKMRYLKDRYFKIPPLTESDFATLGLTPKDTNPTHIGPSTSRPGFEVKPKDVCRVTVRIWDEDTGEKKRPYGMNGAVMAYAVGDAAATLRKDLNRSLLLTKNTTIVTLEDGDHLKTMSIAMCWQTESGERGPWSEIQTAGVP